MSRINVLNYPRDQSELNIVIGEREATYIPESAFEEASMGSAILLNDKEPSSPSLNERRQQIIEKLQNILHIQNWIGIHSIHITILEAAESLFAQERWIEDEELLRKVLLFTLFSLDPANYRPNDPIVSRRGANALWRALIGELKKRGKQDLATKLKKLQTSCFLAS